MSHVCNVVLLMGCGELDDSHATIDKFPALEVVNAWLAENCSGSVLHEVSKYGSNTKSMECYIAIGAFNYLDTDAFIAVALAAPWQDWGCVQLLIQDQEDDTFREYRPSTADQPGAVDG